MIAVIFEVTPADSRKDDYLEIAASLRADLDSIDGFILSSDPAVHRPEAKYCRCQPWRDEE